jgi:SAM-dependent methyltransferase
MHKYVDLLQPPLPGEVLDIGCGWGYLVEALCQRGFACQGIDISAEQVAAARASGVPVAHVSDTLVWLREQIAGGRRWAAIFLLDVIEHLSAEAQIELVALLAQALLPGGQLVLRNPNPDSLVGLRMMYGDYTHRFRPTADALAGLLRASGFSAVTTRDELSWLDPWSEVWPRSLLRPKALLLELFYRLGTPLLRAWRRMLIASELGLDQARRVPLAPNYLSIAVR